MKDLVTPKQVAQAIDVSESSLKRWCDRGLIPTVRTAGGHRRLPVNGVLAFLRNSGYRLVDPEVLGLPPIPAKSSRAGNLEEEQARLLQALVNGNEAVCIEIVINLYLARVPMCRICDQLLARSFQDIGELWGCGDVAVYQERRSCELCHRVIHEIRRALPEIPATGPLAIGGTCAGDPYTLASSMAELVLRENNWNATSLGNMLPFSSLRQALEEVKPKLFWLSVSTISDANAFVTEFAELSEAADQHQVALVVGGQALTPEIRRQMRYSCFCDTFTHLDSFVKQLADSDPLSPPQPGNET